MTGTTINSFFFWLQRQRRRRRWRRRRRRKRRRRRRWKSGDYRQFGQERRRRFHERRRDHQFGDVRRRFDVGFLPAEGFFDSRPFGDFGFGAVPVAQSLLRYRLVSIQVNSLLSVCLLSGPGFICIYRIYRIYRPWCNTLYVLNIVRKYVLHISNQILILIINLYHHHQGL